MPLPPGTRLGPYEIVSPIGAGGMGEVFRAKDSKLKREVALKVLPADVANDRDRLARFQREAEVLASLNHPHIAQIYGLEESTDRGPAEAGHYIALVMELVEGEDLSQRIARGPIPIDEALPIAKQIAEALEAAHEQGIIHRDLKPANIKVRDDGTVKVLDFGLAKAMDTVEGDGFSRRQAEAKASAFQTITSPAMTMRGVILGTAAYMSPEQAKGKPVDKRTDIWAFGCVLYEMLTKRRAFDASDVTETLAFVLTKEPDWQALPSSVPQSIRRLLRRCLEKDPRERLRDIGDARLGLREASEPSTPNQHASAARPRLKVGRVAAAAVLLASGIAVGVLAARALSRTPEAPHLVSRFDITPPLASAVVMSGNTRDLAISRDGRRIAYVGGNGASLFVRDLDRAEPVGLVNTGFPSNPFFSLDGSWVCFTDGADSLKRVPVGGGRVELIARIAAPGVRATPGPADTIIYAMDGSLWRVPFAGGESKLLARPDPKQGEGLAFVNPEFLPAPREAVLFSMVGINSRAGRLGVIDLVTGQQKVLLEDAVDAHYISPGHLVYRSGRTLRAVRFDPERLEAVGAPVPLPDPILITTFGSNAQFDVAPNGTMVFVPADAPVAARRLVWVERDGREQPSNLPVRSYTYAVIAPNGTQAALDIRDQENDIWIWDFARGTLRKLTFGPRFEQSPRWTNDGRQILFNVGSAIMAQRVDGTGTSETLVASQRAALLNAISPDGKRVVFREGGIENGYDVKMATLGDRAVQPLLQTRSNELNAEISPDGRWIAYESDESGAYEIYVRPFPDVSAGRWQISNGGGRKALWNPNGRELFFVSSVGAMMAVPVEGRTGFSAGTPVQLFRHDFFFGSASNLGRTFDVSSDGKRFLMIQEDRSRPTSLSVVLNWTEELKRLVPPDQVR